ncbi:MAG TPA: addiction module antidote protein, HigA family [Bacteroidetes bacterium]|nr:addiction module antidote protein, HigA family [Bacteroidota bacterium]
MTTTIRNEYRPQSVTHPGEDLREKLDELRMTPSEFAVRCNKPVKTISEVMNGKSSITPDMAVQFENVLQIPASYWLKRQYNYDEAMARNKQRANIKAAIPWAREFPFADMARKGWVSPTRKIEEKVEALLDFFCISSHISWENYYIEQKLKGAFRISLAHAKSPYALSAWLQKGENQARKIDAPKYSAKTLKEILPELKSIMAGQPDDFFERIQSLCLRAGVKVVYTPCLKGAPINGVARWIESNATPLIQLSCRHKRNDIFWFSFFHEIGHILLHGKKDIFLEDGQYDEKDMVKEKEADDFAVKWTLTKKEEKAIIQNISLNDDDIIYWAKKLNTHPGIIIGRLQHLKLIPHYIGREFIVKIEVNETV